MNNERNLHCCCNCSFIIFYILFAIIGSLAPIALICDSLINRIPNYNSFGDNWLFINNKNENYNKYNYIDYSKLGIINEEYAKLKDSKNLISIDLIGHLIILPTFVILSFIFVNIFVCCKKDKKLFMSFEIISILLKGLCIADKILFEFKRRKLKSLNSDNTYETNEKLRKIYDDYENYRKKGIISDYYLIASIVLLVVEIICFIILITINNNINKNENSNNNTTQNINIKNISKYSRWAIIFYTVFGFLSISVFIFGHFIYSKCKLKYEDYYRYHNIYDYSYDDYPILKEIMDTFTNNNYEKYSLSKWKEKDEILNNFYIYFWIPAFLFLITLISYILLIFLKCKEKCKKGFIVFESLSVAVKLLIIVFSIILYKTRGLEKKLQNEEKAEVKFLVNDYYKYYKCKAKYPFIIIIQFIYLIVEMINMYFICHNNTINNSVPQNAPNLETPQNQQLETNQNIQQSINPTRQEVRPLNSQRNQNLNINNSVSISLLKTKNRQNPNPNSLKKIEKNIQIQFNLIGTQITPLSIEANILDKFQDVFNNLKNKNGQLFEKNKVFAIILGKEEALFIEGILGMSLKSIKDLKINENSMINIYIKEIIKEVNINMQNNTNNNENENITVVINTNGNNNNNNSNGRYDNNNENSKIDNNNNIQSFNQGNRNNNIQNSNQGNNMNNLRSSNQGNNNNNVQSSNQRNNNNNIQFSNQGNNMNNININNNHFDNSINSNNNNINNMLNNQNNFMNNNIMKNMSINQHFVNPINISNNPSFFNNAPFNNMSVNPMNNPSIPNNLMNQGIWLIPNNFQGMNFYGNNSTNNNNSSNEININFFFINSSSTKIFPLKRIARNQIFNDVLKQLVKKNNTLELYDFNEIFKCIPGGESNYIKNLDIDNTDQTIQTLDINNGEWIYIKGEIKGNNKFINLHFEWVREKEENKKFTLSIGSKTPFHDAVLKLSEKYKEDLDDYIITVLYKKHLEKIKSYNIISTEDSKEIKETERECLALNDNKNNNANQKNNEINPLNDTNYSTNVFKKVFEEIIENENLTKLETLEDLKIDDNTIIYFKTKDNIQRKERKISENERQVFFNYMSKFGNEKKKILIKFYLATNRNFLYNLCIEKNKTFSECIDCLKEKYQSLNGRNITSASLRGNHLYNNENKNKTLEELPLDENSEILLMAE